MIWGGLNTAVGNLVLAGVIQPDSGFDRPGMIGHAYLWDPLTQCLHSGDPIPSLPAIDRIASNSDG